MRRRDLRCSALFLFFGVLHLLSASACEVDLDRQSQSIQGTATVTASLGLRLRSAPSTTAAVLAVMPNASYVQVLGGPDSDFYKVRFASPTGSIEGWAHGSYLDIDASPAPDAGTIDWPDSGPSSNVQKATVTAAYALNLRQGPGTSYPVLASMLEGTVVDLIGGHQNSFYQVLYHAPTGDIAGWAHEYYLELPGMSPSPPTHDAFGYPVGDLTTHPAGGFTVWQVMGHYHSYYGGRHQAQDIASAQGGLATINARVHSVADGVVRYAGPNGSTYRNTVLIEHPLTNGTSICSFYGHINTPQVHTGQAVTRGQPIATIMDWNLAAGGASSNTHLHYVFLSKTLCDVSAAANGALVCGYDKGGASSVMTLADEPATYTSIGDICGDYKYPSAFISPSQFIEAHHF